VTSAPAALRNGSLLTAAFLGLLTLSGCALRPINPPLQEIDHAAGYRFEAREHQLHDRENLLVLAFSGGGTRAAAFSYGVLEALQAVQLRTKDGSTIRALDEIALVTGVSGGSFTALAYGLYGDRLFGQYEEQFLYRNVEGELLDRLLSPVYWGSLWSYGWGRSELAADYYDEILFKGATFGDLNKAKGPVAIASATDLSSGARFYFSQSMFDIMCSDLLPVRLSRAAAASSAVPVVLSPVTFNNYGGRCSYREPPWITPVAQETQRSRAAARVMREVADLRLYEDGEQRPYIHLVDGGVADNLAMRGILDVMEQTEALRLAGVQSKLASIKRIAVIVVNSNVSPKNEWDKVPEAPGALEQLLQATGVPIDHYSYDTIETLRDIASRWAMLSRIRDSNVITDRSSPILIDVMRAPAIEVYVVDVAFASAATAQEREYLNGLPTSFALSTEAVDQLRKSAGSIMFRSTEFQRFLKDAGFTIVRD
jgi:NTE family protein